VHDDNDDGDELQCMKQEGVLEHKEEIRHLYRSSSICTIMEPRWLWWAGNV